LQAPSMHPRRSRSGTRRSHPTKPHICASAPPSHCRSYAQYFQHKDVEKKNNCSRLLQNAKLLTFPRPGPVWLRSNPRPLRGTPHCLPRRRGAYPSQPPTWRNATGSQSKRRLVAWEATRKMRRGGANVVGADGERLNGGRRSRGGGLEWIGCRLWWRWEWRRTRRARRR
jgi:hypothetical protein